MPSDNTPSLVWFRSDLRTRDNPALHHACKRGGPVFGLFLISAEQWREHDWGDNKAAFTLGCARVLRDHLAALNIPLLVRSCPRFADAPDAVHRAMKHIGADSLFLNAEIEINERRRDDAVTAALRNAGLAARSFNDQTILPPGSVLTSNGDTYSVFTPFKKRWIEVLNERLDDDASITKPLAAPKKRESMPAEPDDIPDRLDGFSLASATLADWPPGETEARQRLTRFVQRHIDDYADSRDFPAQDKTSRLSAYLASGAISIRQCLVAAFDTGDGRKILDNPKHKSGASTWISELIWREFYRHLYHAMPRLHMHRPFRPETDDIPWSNDDEHLRAWKEGRTGIPIVDAAMRQLAATGWMHNRLRMVVAMFLTKNLLIDWREGERFFMNNLVDGDLANNNGGWQWAASTGTDAAPYFRIFNPASQSRRYDPEGAFIREFVPELASLDPGDIHAPWELPDLQRSLIDYPAPIVDLKRSREHAIETFKQVLSSD